LYTHKELRIYNIRVTIWKIQIWINQERQRWKHYFNAQKAYTKNGNELEPKKLGKRLKKLKEQDTNNITKRIKKVKRDVQK